jgi:uncharacterized membrane protein (DUF441 family)
MNRSIGRDILETIKRSELSSLAAEYGEVAVDSLLQEDSPWKELPVIGSILAVAKLYGTYSDYLLTKKIMLFLYQLHDILPDERVKVIEQIERETPDFGESLMMIIERCNDSKKPVVLGRVLASYIQGEIDIRMLHNLYHSVVSFDMTLSSVLKSYYAGDGADFHAQQHFVACGLAAIDFGHAAQFGGFPGGGFKKNHVGSELIKYLL